MNDPASPDGLPGWLHLTLTLLLGAGGVRMLDVWLESRRLGRKEHRETLASRISKLEGDVEECHRRAAGLLARVARLEERLAHTQNDLEDEIERAEGLADENDRLRARLLEVDPDRNPDSEG